jgi:hypothetical protein
LNENDTFQLLDPPLIISRPRLIVNNSIQPAPPISMEIMDRSQTAAAVSHSHNYYSLHQPLATPISAALLVAGKRRRSEDGESSVVDDDGNEETPAAEPPSVIIQVERQLYDANRQFCVFVRLSDPSVNAAAVSPAQLSLPLPQSSSDIEMIAAIEGNRLKFITQISSDRIKGGSLPTVVYHPLYAQHDQISMISAQNLKQLLCQWLSLEISLVVLWLQRYRGIYGK